MTILSRSDRWLGFAVCLWAVIVIVPLLVGEQAASANDAIASRLGEDSNSSLKSRLVRNVAGLYYDDGFYYLQIARNVANGAGSTFDGLHPTNGYHPLWLLCLIVLARPFPAPEDLLLASFGLQMLLAAGTTLLVWRLASRLVGSAAAVVAAAVWIRIQCTYWMSWAGMEFGLQALLVVGLLDLYLRGSSRRTGRTSSSWPLQLGLVSSLAFLARLDNVLLAGLLGLTLAWRDRLARRSLALFAVPVVFTVTAYVAFNDGHFGVPWPVSGAMKRAWSFDALGQDPLYQAHGWWIAKAWTLWTPLASLNRSHAISLLLGALGGITWIAVVGRRSPMIRTLWPMAFFALMQYFAYAAVFHGGFSFQPWYFVAQPLITTLFAAWLVDQTCVTTLIRHPTGRRAAIAGVVAVVMVSTAINTARFHNQQGRFSHEPLYVAAGWSRTHLPADARIGAWNAGILAFFSDRQVVNLDGLVNSWPFFLSHRHELCAYLEREHIDTLVDVFDADQPFAQYQDQVSECAAQFEPIWTGPAYPGSSPLRRAIAFRRLPSSTGSVTP